MQKNITSQKALFFAFDSTTNLPKTGDAANITAYVQIDFGTVTVLGDTTATELDATNAKGYYVFDLTQAETNGNTLLFTAKSATANIVVVGAPAVVYTVPPNFSLESIDSNGRVDVIKIAGTTQTARNLGDSVLLSSGTGTGQLDFTSGVVKSNVTQLLGTAWLTPAVAGTPDVNTKLIGGSASVGSAGYVGVDWGQVANKTTTNALTGTTISTSQTIATVTNQLTAAQIATGVWQDSTGTDFTTASSIGKALYTGNFVPGAAGGLFIAGTNAATTITGSLTTTFTGDLTGAVGSIGSGGISTSSFAAGAINAAAIADGAIDNATFAADTGLQTIRSGTAQATGNSTTAIKLDASASGTADYYKGAAIYLTGGTGAGQSRIITAYDQTTKIATITPAWTAPDNTTTFAILARGPSDIVSTLGTSSTGAAGYMGIDWAQVANKTSTVGLTNTTVGTVTAVTGQLTGSQIATAIWTDSTGSDFTTASSIGKALYTGNFVPGAAGGLFIAGTNAATTITGSLTTTFTGNLTGSVDSVTTRVTANTDQLAGQTVTAPVGVTFPSSVASPTNITAGTITTVTNQLTAAQIATGVWTDSTGSDFTTASSIGKALYTGNFVPGAAGGLFIAGTNAATTITTALTTTFTGSLTGSVNSVTGSVGSVASGGITAASFATDAISAAAVASATVDKIWAKTMTELSAVPGVTADILSGLAFIFEMTRNKIEQNSTTQTVYKDDGSTTLATSTISDSAGTYTRGKFS